MSIFAQNTNMNDILNEHDVTLLVDAFYGKVLKDELLAPFFKNIDFEHHKPRMIHFWSFVLLDVSGYTTNVTDKHLNMPLQKEHFDRWLTLFFETIDAHFSGEKAETAKQRAKVVGWTIASKMN